MVGGIFKIVAALSYRFAAWGWSLAGGIIDVILGVMIWQEWPASGLWVIGLFVGINLLFRGVNWIALGLALLATPPGGSLSPSHEMGQVIKDHDKCEPKPGADSQARMSWVPLASGCGRIPQRFRLQRTSRLA